MSYMKAHADRTKRSKASEHACVRCKNRAHEWAFTNTCAETLWGNAGNSRESAYCVHDWHYLPMCRVCHRNTDRPLRLSRTVANADGHPV